MIRGTTPTNIFNTNINLTDIDSLYITYSQSGVTKIEKKLSDVLLSDKIISVILGQADTLKLKPGNLEIQITVKLNDGTVLRCHTIETTVEKILKDGVI